MSDGSATPSPPIHDRLEPAVYDELRAIAHRHLGSVRRGDGRDATLATTALVHEAYLKLAGSARDGYRDHPHFLATAALAMRQILIDRARARASLKRGDHASTSRSTRRRSVSTISLTSSSKWTRR